MPDLPLELELLDLPPEPALLELELLLLDPHAATSSAAAIASAIAGIRRCLKVISFAFVVRKSLGAALRRGVIHL